MAEVEGKMRAKTPDTGSWHLRRVDPIPSRTEPGVERGKSTHIRARVWVFIWIYRCIPIRMGKRGFPSTLAP